MKRLRISEGSVRHHSLCLRLLTKAVMIISSVRSFDYIHLVDAEHLTVFCQLVFTVLSSHKLGLSFREPTCIPLVSCDLPANISLRYAIMWKVILYGGSTAYFCSCVFNEISTAYPLFCAS